jgi:hypothetical protein
MFHQATNVCKYFADMICIFSTPFAFFFAKGGSLIILANSKRKKLLMSGPGHALT